MKVHPIANLFPPQPEETFRDLVESIQTFGLREPILVREDVLGDGRHRLRACKKAGVEPRFSEFDGTEEAFQKLILDLNSRTRRHLTDNQREMIAGKLATASWGRPSAKRPNGHLTIEQAATAMSVSPRNARRARKVLESGDQELIGQVQRGELAVSKAAAQVPKKPKQQPQGSHPALTYSVAQWDRLGPEKKTKVLGDTPPRGSFNQQETESIDWAKWSWNPVTGCEHGCRYCYARDIASRYYPQKFAPTLLPERLLVPSKMTVPEGAADDISLKNVFTCSMADLFGKWVPTEWITAVLSIAEKNPQWNFLFLTKNPRRYRQFSFPPNAWVGTTVDRQARVSAAEAAFDGIDAAVKWLSVEPMLTPLKFSRLELFQWLVIGGASPSTKTPEWRVPADWWAPLHAEAKAKGLRVYHKTNLYDRKLELDFPGAKPQKVTAPAVMLK